MPMTNSIQIRMRDEEKPIVLLPNSSARRPRSRCRLRIVPQEHRWVDPKEQGRHHSDESLAQCMVFEGFCENIPGVLCRQANQPSATAEADLWR